MVENCYAGRVNVPLCEKLPGNGTFGVLMFVELIGNEDQSLVICDAINLYVIFVLYRFFEYCVQKMVIL